MAAAAMLFRVVEAMVVLAADDGIGEEGTDAVPLLVKCSESVVVDFSGKCVVDISDAVIVAFDWLLLICSNLDVFFSALPSTNKGKRSLCTLKKEVNARKCNGKEREKIT